MAAPTSPDVSPALASSGRKPAVPWTRVVIGVGEESGQAVAGRAGAAVAERLGLAPVVFPGGHDGFLGGEYGGMGKPDAFAATLRTVLAGA